MENYTNAKVRNMFNEWVKTNYYPANKIIAKEINISYFSLMRWKNNQIDFGQLNLMKVLFFLQSFDELNQTKPVGTKQVERIHFG